MSKIYILMGKSATGKDTVYRKVVEACGEQVKEIITYTTRPMRIGECEGRDYHFTNNEQVEEYRRQGKVIELRTYHTVHGDWLYYTVDDGQFDMSSDKKYVVINTLEAYEQFVNYFGSEQVVPIYIEISEKERIHRALRREDEQEIGRYTEMCRRFLADEKDFSEENLEHAGIRAENRFANYDLEQCVSSIVETILK